MTREGYKYPLRELATQQGRRSLYEFPCSTPSHSPNFRTSTEHKTSHTSIQLIDSINSEYFSRFIEIHVVLGCTSFCKRCTAPCCTSPSPASIQRRQQHQLITTLNITQAYHLQSSTHHKSHASVIRRLHLRVRCYRSCSGSSYAE